MPTAIETLALPQAISAVAVLAILLLLETAHPFFAFFSARRKRGAHVVKNLLIGLGNTAVIALVFAGLWVAASEWAEARGFGLLRVVDAAVGLPTWAHVLLAVVLLDLWTYWWHRINHVIPFLWRFHRVHHADAQMDVSTASRFHVGEIVLSSALRIPVIVLLGVSAWQLVFYEIALFVVVQFHHANIGLPAWADRVTRALIVTPAMHKVHHSRWQTETDSNYSSLLSVWDRLFGSFRLRKRLEDIRIGLDGYDTPEHESFGGLFRMPWSTPPSGPPVEDASEEREPST